MSLREYPRKEVNPIELDLDLEVQNPWFEMIYQSHRMQGSANIQTKPEISS